jgi:hypothetical protein
VGTRLKFAEKKRHMMSNSPQHEFSRKTSKCSPFYTWITFDGRGCQPNRNGHPTPQAVPLASLLDHVEICNSVA